MDGATERPTESPTENLGAIVLAGGRSRRMGTDKAVLDFCGRRMIDVVTGRLQEIADRIVVVTRKRADIAPLDAVVVEDEQPYAGPLPALIAGLRATGAERNVVVACDMPLLNVELLQSLCGALDDQVDAVVPLTDAGPEPLHAAFGDCAVEPLLASIAAGERSLRGALDRLRVRWVAEDEWREIDPDGRSFLNVNTPEELQTAITLQTT